MRRSAIIRERASRDTPATSRRAITDRGAATPSAANSTKRRAVTAGEAWISAVDVVSSRTVWDWPTCALSVAATAPASAPSSRSTITTRGKNPVPARAR